MTSDSEFNTIRPYCDSEIEAAIERLCKSEEFLTLFTHLTKMDRATIQGALQGIRSRAELDRKSTRLNSSHPTTSRMPSSA